MTPKQTFDIQQQGVGDARVVSETVGVFRSMLISRDFRLANQRHTLHGARVYKAAYRKELTCQYFWDNTNFWKTA